MQTLGHGQIKGHAGLAFNFVSAPYILDSIVILNSVIQSLEGYSPSHVAKGSTTLTHSHSVAGDLHVVVL